MNRTAIGRIILIAIVVNALGCAAIFKGQKQKVDLSSDPSEVQVYINGHLRGTTPLTLKLRSKDTHHIEFKKQGYKTRTVVIDNHVGAGWIVLDVIFGLIPVVVDAATGSWYVLDEREYNAIMEPDGISMRLVPADDT